MACLAGAVALAVSWSAGCAGASGILGAMGSPFLFTGRSGGGGGGIIDDGSSLFDGGGRGNVDPCSEPLNRKFVSISMRNMNPDDYIHYFLLLVAYVNSETYPDGAVCPDDKDLYLSFGYDEIREGEMEVRGNFCIVGPALVYFHRNGQFRSAGGTGTQLASAIGPAQGTSPTYDAFFAAGGAQVPVPNLILFHNPGSSTDSRALKISVNDSDPCDTGVVRIGDPPCEQDAFYYVDETDRLARSTALGFGSGRRVPAEIQGTSCECRGTSDPGQQLAPSGTTASTADCNEFLRGGRIEYVFLLEDTEPPFPQLVWRVTDATGTVAHEFDPRANIP